MNPRIPPYTLTTTILNLTNAISEAVAEISVWRQEKITPILRRRNRVRSITGSLQIEGNTLTEEEVTAILDGRMVLGTVREIEEVKGAIEAYEGMEAYGYRKLDDLLEAHRRMMGRILEHPGAFRRGNVGVAGAEGLTHIAPPPHNVPRLMEELFGWLSETEEHPLVASCVFHYEFEYIHPFPDGNGRIGRLWQSVILGSYREIFYTLPIESIVREHQKAYYQALEEASLAGESTPFIEFMLDAIHQAVLKFQREYKSDQKSNQKSDQKIYALMEQDPTITIQELMLRLHMSESGIKKQIAKLKKAGRLARVGGAKGGRWEVQR